MTTSRLGLAKISRDARSEKKCPVYSMMEGLTTRLVETQSILSSFTMKVEMLLLRGRESASDADCLIVEDEGPTGIAESELMKHDCIFMRNMNSTGSNLLVRTCILLNFTII